MSGIHRRGNIFHLGGDWPEPILWYARGVQAMKARKLAERTSWPFFAAMHGIARPLWDHYGHTLETDDAPDSADTGTYIDQCQHQSWYFLPWHRGYLLAFEAVIRHEIALLGGPHEDWALPYWNYLAPGENVLPPAFRGPSWPDGAADNPLFVKQRWGVLSGADAVELEPMVNVRALGTREFTAAARGGLAGFGGPVTGFSWRGTTNGGLENNPHNVIHGAIGGESPDEVFDDGTPLPGLMTTPRCAALDPIFYLHHCNIDRLWESWNKFPAGKPQVKPTDWRNPQDNRWIAGPASLGQRLFAMPRPDGSQWTYTPAEMGDIAALGYEYEDLSPGAPVPIMDTAERMVNLGLSDSIETASAVLAAPGADGDLTMAADAEIEMVGASESGLAIAGDRPVAIAVRTETEPRERVLASLQPSLTAEETIPDRVFLNLEDVTAASDVPILLVYVGLPAGANPTDHPENYAGTASLFGVAEASDPEGAHAGSGITYAMEITPIVDRLYLSGDFDLAELAVLVVPWSPVPEASKVHIGRVSLYRQAQ